MPAELSSGAVAPRQSDGTRAFPLPSETSGGFLRNRRLRRRWPPSLTSLRRTPPHSGQHFLHPSSEGESHLGAPPLLHWQLLDYVLVRRRNWQNVMVSKVICNADGWTDHRLIISKMGFPLQPHRRPQSTNRRSGCKTYQLQIKTSPWRADGACYETAFIQLPWPSSATHFARISTWFEENAAVIGNLLAKNRLHSAYVDRATYANKATFHQCRRLAQQRLREMSTPE
nr:unnamed protein product [Spirometra erinaceieuropaei]